MFKHNDIVYHLEGVGFGSVETVKSLVGRLNGTKILIRGNHDFKIGTNTWKEIGFLEVYKKKNVFDKYQSYFNKDLIVVAHSIGNPMFIKYISKNNLNIGQYISLAGFSKDYYNEGKDVLNEKVKLAILTKNKRYKFYL